MKNRKESIFELQELQIDSIRKQKRGLHFIMASVFVRPFQVLCKLKKLI